MPEPLKNLFNPEIVNFLAGHIARAWPEFDRAGFETAACDGLDGLELKARSAQITKALATTLPDDFAAAGRLLLEILAPLDGGDPPPHPGSEGGVSGWTVMPLTHYVALRGQAHFDLSMALLREMTKRATAEFDIRFFLLEDQPRTLEVLETWTRDDSRHVRRLVSEGTRPRLPWAMRLPALMADPAPILPLLEALRDDPDDYVRRSVANNLNDIAKDHPDLVAGIAERWLVGASAARKRLVRHACRSLVKQGHQPTLRALGYSAPAVQLEALRVKTPRVRFGGALIFEMVISSTAKTEQELLLDYVVHHRKANGRLSGKVFKWKTSTLAPGASLRGLRRHAMRPITTRVYYPGRHRLEVMANGVSLGITDFELVI